MHTKKNNLHFQRESFGKTNSIWLCEKKDRTCGENMVGPLAVVIQGPVLGQKQQ